VSSPALHASLVKSHLSQYDPAFAPSSLPLDVLLDSSVSLSNFSTILFSVPSVSTFGKASNTALRAIVHKIIDLCRYSTSNIILVDAKSNFHNARENNNWRKILQSGLIDKCDDMLLESSGGERSVAIVVGGGGREHAIARSLAESVHIKKVILTPGNGGTSASFDPTGPSFLRKIVNADVSVAGQSNSKVLELIESLPKNSVALVAVGPEAPLVDGLTDAVNEHSPDIPVFGPTQSASILESSKAFVKDYLTALEVPTATYKNFTDVNAATEYVQNDIPDSAFPNAVVVKASGLAAGKGVLIPEGRDNTVAAVKEIMADKSFGSAGDTCVIEQFLVGLEVSCICWTDGHDVIMSPPAQDHKRAFDGDEGPNTGGMGVFAPVPRGIVSPAEMLLIEDFCRKVVRKMASDGRPYRGILYAGCLLPRNTVDKRPSILEFNCRFGDPEAEVLLPLMEGDALEVMVRCAIGSATTVSTPSVWKGPEGLGWDSGLSSRSSVAFKDGYSATTVIMASGGYPGKYPKGINITGIPSASELESENTIVFHAGTKLNDEKKLVTSGGRVLSVTGVSRGTTLQPSIDKAYKTTKKIHFGDDNSEMWRTDIAQKGVKSSVKIGVLGSTRGTSLQGVIDAINGGSLKGCAAIALIISNKKDAGILSRAESHGIESLHLPFKKGGDKDAYDANIAAEFNARGVDLILCVGWMRILSKSFCEFWQGKIYNVHPSLLPLHAGGMDLEVHQEVLDHKEKESGCTIHEVTAVVDGGPIVLQKKVKVDESDTAESLKAKVQPLESVGFIEAVGAFWGKRANVDWRKTHAKEVLTYAGAGVDIVAGDDLVQRIKPYCKRTRRPGCDADLGGFGGLFDLSKWDGFASGGVEKGSDPIVVGATDGVGTKLLIAQNAGIHQFVGIDLVAMCVNDLLGCGAEPLFFLDYYATGGLSVDAAADVVKGIAEGCVQSNCGLIGGETAEMPQMYSPGEYDLAGFSVGCVRREDILPKFEKITGGQVLIGLSSSGVHSNGFSLVRKCLKRENLDFTSNCPWSAENVSVAQDLLTPTRIYIKSVMPLIKKKFVLSTAHITGGGLLENLNRALPDGIDATVTWHPKLPRVFAWLKNVSGLDDDGMLRTFNCGVGMILVVAEKDKEAVLDHLNNSEECAEIDAFDMGTTTKQAAAEKGAPKVIVKCTLEV